MASTSEEPKQAEKKNTFPRLQLRAKTSAPAPSDAADTPDTADAAPADGTGAGDGLGDEGQAKHDWHASTKPAEPAKASGSDAWPPPPPRPSARVPAKARPTSRPARAGQLGQLPIPPMPVPMMPMPMPMPGMPGPAVPYMPMRGFLTVPHAPYMGCRPHMEPTEARCRPVVSTLRPVTVWVDDSGFVHAPPPRPPPLPAELPVEQPQSPPKQPEHPTPVDSFRAAFTPPNVAKGNATSTSATTGFSEVDGNGSADYTSSGSASSEGCTTSAPNSLSPVMLITFTVSRYCMLLVCCVLVMCSYWHARCELQLIRAMWT